MVANLDAGVLFGRRGESRDCAIFLWLFFFLEVTCVYPSGEKHAFFWQPTSVCF